MRQKLFLLLWISAFIASLTVATTYLGYAIDVIPPDYGPAYYPWRIFHWTVIYRWTDAFTHAWTIAGAFTAIFTTLILVRYYKAKPTNTGTYGSARWLRTKEIVKSGALKSGGVILGQTDEAKYKPLPGEKWKLKRLGRLIFDDQDTHILCVAPTRSGKGIGFVIPSLLSWTGSVIVYDIKKENWNLTSGWRSKFSHSIRFEPTSEDTPRFNPLLEIEKGSEQETAQVQMLVEILSDPNGENKTDHWRRTASQLLAGLMVHVIYTETKTPENMTLYRIFEILNTRNLGQLWEEMKTTPHTDNGVHPIVFQTAVNMANKAENELSSVVSTASSYLQLWQDPIVARATSASDWKADDLMRGKHPVSLFLIVPPADDKRLRPLTRLMLQFLGQKLTATLGGYNHKLLFLIDEFASLGNLDFFQRQLAFFAGYGIKCAMIIQGFTQLYDLYSINTSIPSNCRTKVFLGADNPADAELVVKYLGQETISRRSESRSGKISAIAAVTKSVSNMEVGKELMSADEILRFPKDKVLLIRSGMYPYLGGKIMWFLDKRFKPRVVPARTPEEERLDLPGLYNQEAAGDPTPQDNKETEIPDTSETANQDSPKEELIEEIPANSYFRAVEPTPDVGTGANVLTEQNPDSSLQDAPEHSEQGEEHASEDIHQEEPGAALDEEEPESEKNANPTEESQLEDTVSPDPETPENTPEPEESSMPASLAKWL